MLRSSLCCVAAAVSLVACTSAPPQADSLEWSETEYALELVSHAADHIPELEVTSSLPYDLPTPMLIFVEHDVEEAGMVTCPFSVRAEGFPAVSADATTIVQAAAMVLGNGESDDEFMHVQWMDSTGEDADVITSLYDRGEHWQDGPEDEGHVDCAPFKAATMEAIAAVNGRLDRGGYITLRELDVLVPDRHRWDWGADEPLDARDLPADARPVEVLYNGGQFIARVRGHEVLQRTERPDLTQYGDESCSRTPHFSTLYGNRDLGVALLEYDHVSGGCLCDDETYWTPVALDDRVFAEAAARSTSAMDSLADDSE